jgi:hypothetical protein
MIPVPAEAERNIKNAAEKINSEINKSPSGNLSFPVGSFFLSHAVFLFIFPFLPVIFFQRQGLEYGLSGDKADNLCHDQPGKDADAVNAHITQGGTPTSHKGLMVFI